MQSTSDWPGESTSWNQDCQEKYHNLRYADDTTLMAESKEEVKSLLMKMKEESEKAVLKLNIQNTKITSWCDIINTVDVMTQIQWTRCQI